MHSDSKPNSPSLGLSSALALMAKAPFAGAVKTRLIPPLTFDLEDE